ncbi:hypothetical protein M422DRAFT_250786 [Sphaerobolus stellatus SS14]|uniref:Uncharacterized protein n=1 Tax=Sphaerobolus stellatus (strain SS14) TaxID=990650 RepID=A0A0C9VSK7_SPHS4|nr:hypothetical protein M422DRAFT_250786 [Sphaerobolus stellatus SS14]
MEKNVYAGLKDLPTFEELCVLALFSQSVSHPYMHRIRGVKNQNALNLGPFHDKVLVFLESVIAEPTKLFSLVATSKTASLDGQIWDRPEVLEKIQSLAPRLPHLEPLVVAFFSSAVEGWKRFTEEFQPDGKISSLSAESRLEAFMEPTNDINEGALGSFRKVSHLNPNITLQTINSRAMVKRNDTVPYIAQKFDSEDRKHLHHEARLRNNGQQESG